MSVSRKKKTIFFVDNRPEDCFNVVLLAFWLPGLLYLFPRVHRSLLIIIFDDENQLVQTRIIEFGESWKLRGVRVAECG